VFHVPRTAGGHPRLILGVTAAVVVGASAWAAVKTVAAPRLPVPTASAPPERAPLKVVEDLPILKARLDRGDFMGGVLVSRGDQVLFRQVYGMANRERGEPLALDSRFRLASVSKQFTTAAILKLQDEGKLSVADPLCKWIQPCPEAWAPIRLHHLMSHTSGVPDLMAQAEWGRIRVTPRTPQELTEATARYRLQFEPGTKVRYSNAGFNLLGVVVEKASGVSYEAYLKQALFDPLGLDHTGSDADDRTQGLVMGYGDFPGGLTPQPLANVSVVFASGALYSSLDDLMIWNRALHGGAVLTPFSYAQMIADHAPEDTPRERGRQRRAYGYGLYVNSLGMRTNAPFADAQIYHTGSWAGFRNLVVHEPEHDVTVVVLSNNYHRREQVLMITQQALAEALGKPVPTRLAN
jgi:CubicO group peptidase (beta-lactamase class C family)